MDFEVHDDIPVTNTRGKYDSLMEALEKAQRNGGSVSIPTSGGSAAAIAGTPEHKTLVCLRLKLKPSGLRLRTRTQNGRLYMWLEAK